MSRALRPCFWADYMRRVSGESGIHKQLIGALLQAAHKGALLRITKTSDGRPPGRLVGLAVVSVNTGK